MYNEFGGDESHGISGAGGWLQGGDQVTNVSVNGRRGEIIVNLVDHLLEVIRILTRKGKC